MTEEFGVVSRGCTHLFVGTIAAQEVDQSLTRRRRLARRTEAIGPSTAKLGQTSQLPRVRSLCRVANIRLREIPLQTCCTQITPSKRNQCHATLGVDLARCIGLRIQQRLG